MPRSETTSETTLPGPFRDLEPFAGWAIATEWERMAARETASMAELQAFYDAMIGRLPAITAYLDQFPLNDMSPEAQRLLYMALSLTEVSIAVERYRQPLVINGRERARFYPGR